MRQGQKSQSRVRHQRSIGRYNSPYQRGGTIFQMPRTSFGMPTYRRYRLDPTIIRAIRQRRQPKGGKVHSHLSLGDQRPKTYKKATHTSVNYQSVNMSLNLFDVPGIDYRYEAKRWIPFKPAITGRRPILFTVPSCDDYFDLNETKLEVKVRMNTAGTNGLSANETGASDGNNTKYMYCVNNFGHTLFNQMNVSFNGVLMTERSNACHQKAYLETL